MVTWAATHAQSITGKWQLMDIRLGLTFEPRQVEAMIDEFEHHGVLRHHDDAPARK